MFKSSLIILTSIGLLVSCNKTAGSGGTSALRGKVVGIQLAEAGKAENTEVLCTSGANLEHGNYWLLNSANTAKYYYIYYTNPTWISNANPNLAGRIGIAVSFNYSDSNIDIALKTQLALAGISAAPFSVTRSQDIIRIIHATQAAVPDADNGTTSFAIDVADQGKAPGLQSSAAAGDERVYITYGDNAFYSNTVRTDNNGMFSFDGLRNGTYKIYVIGNDPQTPNATLKEEKSATIVEKASIQDIGEFSIYF